MVRPQIKIILTRVPRISDLCHPYESSRSADFCAHLSDNIEIAKPIISDARWAESVKMAIDFARYPPTTWTIMKKNETKHAISNFFIAV